ncbi:MAG TPA: hypothetical protein DC049_02800 [Spirochaetia bacterium]|nr:hypothetical protein [Spirochaetia bacterium]
MPQIKNKSFLIYVTNCRSKASTWPEIMIALLLLLLTAWFLHEYSAPFFRFYRSTRLLEETVIEAENFSANSREKTRPLALIPEKKKFSFNIPAFSGSAARGISITGLIFKKGNFKYQYFIYEK